MTREKKKRKQTKIQGERFRKTENIRKTLTKDDDHDDDDDNGK